MGGNVLSNLSGVSSVVHEEQFNVFLVSEQKLAETTGEHVTGVFGLLASNLGHTDGTLESASDRAIYTLGSSPVCL